MDYFRILDFHKEPFANSPDPEIFFQSRQHQGCLQKLELALRLRRGLNVVIGEVGTGKTTLCRQLIRKLANDPKMQPHLVLDPLFSSTTEFLGAVAAMFLGEKPAAGTSDWQLKERIKQFLFRQGVDHDQTVILLIDEGQKLPACCLEILREFLNYETNEYKLLQIIIFAQKEFEATIAAYDSFADRINLRYFLTPLNFRETRAMIRCRLAMAWGRPDCPAFFDFTALWVVYRRSRGYPRKIINLCHSIILTLIIQNRRRAGWPVAAACARQMMPARHRAAAGPWVGGLALAALLVLIILPGRLPERLVGRRPEPGPPTGPARLAQQSRPAPATAAPAAAVVAPARVAHLRLRAMEFKKSPLTLAGLEPPPIMEHQAGTMPSGAAGGRMALPPAEKAAPPAGPEFLAELKVGRHQTLGEMISQVYGVTDPLSNPVYMEQILRYNSQIDSPDRIAVGDIIRFPAIRPESIAMAGVPAVAAGR